MHTTPHVEALQRQLVAAAAAGGPEAEEAASRLATALEAAAHLAILEALSEASGEITRDLAPGSVDLRLRGRDVEFVVSRPSTDAPAVAATAPAPPRVEQPEEGEDASTSRTTLRLPDALKGRAEAAATAEGISLNTWLVRAITAAVEPPKPRETKSSSLAGWVR